MLGASDTYFEGKIWYPEVECRVEGPVFDRTSNFRWLRFESCFIHNHMEADSPSTTETENSTFKKSIQARCTGKHFIAFILYLWEQNSLCLSNFRRERASSAAYKNIQFMRVKRSCWPNLAKTQNSAALLNWPRSRREVAKTLLGCRSIPMFQWYSAKVPQIPDIRHLS